MHIILTKERLTNLELTYQQKSNLRSFKICVVGIGWVAATEFLVLMAIPFICLLRAGAITMAAAVCTT